MAKYVGAIDQGTTSTRFILFNRKGQIIGRSQKEHRQIYPRPGWVEHDALEIWENTKHVICDCLKTSRIKTEDLVAIGITNQRETTVLWDRNTGKPLYHAIVWQDTRTLDICNKLSKKNNSTTSKTGLPITTYFSGPKLRWLRENLVNIPEDAIFGTIDTWLLWNLTGGTDGGEHKTDVTNASRTLLMNLKSLSWDQELLELFGVPSSFLPSINPSSTCFGYTDKNGFLKARVPITGILGDQQAALVGQVCFEEGESKNTYGTGCFMLLNTGDRIVRSENGLLTTVAYRFGENPPAYALEGSIAIAGALVQWLRDNLGLFSSSADIDVLASQVEDNGGVYFVPAFSGLFAPHWNANARGLIIGLTRFADKGHIARAALEATAFQTREVLEAMRSDSAIKPLELKVDGGMVVSEPLMQFQADILGIPVVRPEIIETTALGAAYAAGLAVGYWQDLMDLKANWTENKRWIAHISEKDAEKGYNVWKKAIIRTLDWLE